VQHKVDHEVSVLVHGSKVTVISLDHKIDKVVIWEGIGKLPPQSIGTWGAPGTNGFSKSGGHRATPPPGAQGKPLPEQDAWRVELDLPGGTEFPICIDVYENGASIHGGAAETPDVHRHGWFGEHGTIRHGGGYGEGSEADASSEEYKGWYGLIENEESSSLPAPLNPRA
jgi:hypothetical protein